MPVRDADVVIAGGGIAGLVLARALDAASRGALSIVVLERNATASPSAAQALAISAGSKRLLDAIGVWPAVAAAAQPVSGVDITDSALGDAIRPLLLTCETALEGNEPGLWIVPARALHQAARAAVDANAAIRYRTPAMVIGIERDAASVRLALEDGAAIGASLAVATDGRGSTLREAAGIKTVSWSYGQIGIVAIVGHERPHHGRAVQHFLPAGPFAILPLTGNRSCVTWSEKEEEAQRILALDDNAFLGELERRFGHKLGGLTLESERASWPLNFQMARELVAPRLALAGDAARGVHPIAGQGLNLGLRDVAALTECVVDAMRVGLEPSDASALERYARWRRFDSAVSAGAYGALNALFSRDGALTRAVRDAGLGLVDRLPGLKRALVNEAAGLTGDVPRLLRGELPII